MAVRIERPALPAAADPPQAPVNWTLVHTYFAYEPSATVATAVENAAVVIVGPIVSTAAA